ncbi:hypothetical protein Tco_0858696 [Tanacetum coccineum]|uniref:Retrovirus-related Pol polyprotein from transposon TNT 1-94 n=1 Tax=Tanacetum coccineum TaxID=301880 RepID=A0ABQ5BDW4_9ASTR
MAESNVPKLVDKKGGSDFAIAPRLEVGPFQPKTTKGENKPEPQWSNDERRVVNQDQYLKSIIISCLPNDIIESVIKSAIAKDTWTDLVHANEGPLYTKENRIMDLKLEYNTFRKGQKDYRTKYKKDKAKLALLEVGSSSTQSLKPFQTNIKGLVAKTFDWEEEELTSNDDDMVQVKVVLALLEYESITVGKNHARNGEWVNITMRKANLLLSMDDDSYGQTFLKYINVDIMYVEE